MDQRLARARRRFESVLQMMLACLLAGLIALEVMQVLLRYFLSGGLVWGRDVSTLMLFSIAWLGLPLGWLKGAHIAVDLLPRLQVGRWALRVLINLVALAFAFVLFVFTLRAYDAFTFIELPSLGVAASIKFVPIIVGTVLLFVAAALNLLSERPGPDGG